MKNKFGIPVMSDKQSSILQQAIMDLTESYDKALDNGYVLKPMAYALYDVWKKYDEKGAKANGR